MNYTQFVLPVLLGVPVALGIVVTISQFVARQCARMTARRVRWDWWAKTSQVRYDAGPWVTDRVTPR